MITSDSITSFDFAQQIAADGSDFLVAGFSDPFGVYSISATGVDNGVVAAVGTSGIRGVYRLGNGDILWSNSSGLALNNDAQGSLLGTADRFISFTTIPEPATVALLGFGGLTLLRRRGKR